MINIYCFQKHIRYWTTLQDPRKVIPVLNSKFQTIYFKQISTYSFLKDKANWLLFSISASYKRINSSRRVTHLRRYTAIKCLFKFWHGIWCNNCYSSMLAVPLNTLNPGSTEAMEACCNKMIRYVFEICFSLLNNELICGKRESIGFWEFYDFNPPGSYKLSDRLEIC